MSMTAALEAAERRLVALINRQADEEEEARRADDRERVRADDLRCRDLAAEFQEDYAAHGATPPLVHGDEWASDYHRRLLRGLQRRLSPRSDLADPHLLDEVTGRVLKNMGDMIRAEAGSKGALP